MNDSYAIVICEENDSSQIFYAVLGSTFSIKLSLPPDRQQSNVT